MSSVKTWRRFALSAYIAAGAFVSAQASPNDLRVEWSLLGPAFSKHSTLDGAPIVKPASLNNDCRTYVTTIGLNAIECDTSIIPEVRKWSENNPAIGIERSEVYDDHTNKIFISAVRDSFGDMGIMAGVARLWPTAIIGSFNINVGLSGGFWNRTVLTGVRKVEQLMAPVGGGMWSVKSDTSRNISILERRTAPFIFPVASITEKNTGLGVNIAFVPRVKIIKYSPVPTATLMIQTSYRF